MGSRSSAQNHIREIHDFSDMTELDEISSQIVSHVSGNCPEDKDSEESETSPDSEESETSPDSEESQTSPDSEESETSPVSTPLETTLFSSDVVVGEQLNTMSTESTFSPQFMSTRIDDSSSSYSSRRNRKQRVRYSPTPSTSDFY